MPPIPVYVGEPFPDPVTKQLFLAGPTPRDDQTPSWRPEALCILEKLGYDGHVYIPERRGGGWHHDMTEQIEWEEAGLKRADCILFWIPRVMATMPGLTTNVEFGMWCQSGKVVLGSPPGASHVGYLHYYAQKLAVPNSDRLEQTVIWALMMIGDGAERRGIATNMPLQIWHAWRPATVIKDSNPQILDFSYTTQLHVSVTYPTPGREYNTQYNFEFDPSHH